MATIELEAPESTAQHFGRAALHVVSPEAENAVRLLERYTNKNDLVLDPFGGVMSVPYVATKMRRRSIGIELNWQYWKYGCQFCERLEKEMHAPTLFDMMDESETESQPEESYAVCN